MNLAKFFILGGILSVCEWAFFYSLSLLVHYLLANIIAFILFSLIGVFVYKGFIFAESRFSLKTQIFITYLINIIGLALSTGILYALVEFDLSILSSKIISSFLVAFYGYFARKRFIY